MADAVGLDVVGPLVHYGRVALILLIGGLKVSDYGRRLAIVKHRLSKPKPKMHFPSNNVTGSWVSTAIL